ISYSDMGLAPSTTYTYTVEANDGAWNGSGQSAPVSATTLAASAQSVPSPTAPSQTYPSQTYPSEAPTVTANSTIPVIPLPSTAQIFAPYAPTASPIMSIVPALAEPVGVGTVAYGGNTLSLQIGTYQYSGPVDVYLAISVPEIDPVNLYILTPGGFRTVAEGGIAPWKSNVLAVNETPIADVPVSLLPDVTFNVIAAVTPAGTVGSFHIWQTSFKP
ncbi:MAG TPA: hypothetical protein VFG09_13730, partial [Thermodesulfovibrionales bacterium]|nr:hypothetical protein [Thermodesulfovibrionales bacterium]